MRAVDKLVLEAPEHLGLRGFTPGRKSNHKAVEVTLNPKP